MDGDIKNRPAHQLAGAHRRGAIYLIAPCAPREAPVGFSFERFATAFMNHPG
jgi:hypothetical protein